MDDDAHELIILLCTRAGAIMEDASVIALTVGAQGTGQRSVVISDLRSAADRIDRLIGAAEALQR